MKHELAIERLEEAIMIEQAWVYRYQKQIDSGQLSYRLVKDNREKDIKDYEASIATLRADQAATGEATGE